MTKSISIRTMGLASIVLPLLLIGCTQPGTPSRPAVAPSTPALPDLTKSDKIQVGGQPLFATWPKDKPDLVLVLSGQSYGYLSPCGCSRPQLGGLERRYNLVQSLKAKGWDVAGVDLGDMSPAPGKGLSQQGLMKYAYFMKSLKEMGYVAVGLGKHEFQADVKETLGQFAVNNEGGGPIVLSANLVEVERDPNDKTKILKSTPREKAFEAPKSRPLVEDVEVVSTPKINLGLIGLVGPSLAAEIVEVASTYDFEKPGTALPAALKKIGEAKIKPDLNVLLYYGTRIEAMQAAKDHPEIQVILCASDPTDSEAPMFPVAFPADNPTTQIIQVGHKGRHVGLLGIFKTEKGLDLRYQVVPLGEEFLTPEKPVDLAKDNKVLQLLEAYTAEVKDGKLLEAWDKKLKANHVAMVQQPDAKLSYIGVDACAKCHANEVKKWKDTKHSHAYEALEKYATKPGLRQFDPDCVVCHTTGFEYKTGFSTKETTKHLLNNGCENCHGPGSGHAAKPNDKDLLKLLAPWKLSKDDKLPPLDYLEKMAKIPEAERGKVQVDNKIQRVVRAVDSNLCRKCHDLDNDPKFDIWTYLPKIYHSGLKDEGLPK